MVAKLKAKPMVAKRSASANLPLAKRKKFTVTGKSTRIHSDSTLGSLETTSKKQGNHFGDEIEEESSEDESQEVSERSSSEEDEQVSDAEAEGADHLFPVLKSKILERDSDSDENSNEEQHKSQDLLYMERDEEMEALDKEYKELQAQEVDTMLHNLKGRSDEEVLKGQAVRSQKALWDKALEVRILLQKPFSSANRLPLGDTRLHISESNKEVDNAFAKLCASSIKTLDCLHQTVKVLMNQNDSMNRTSDAYQGNEKHFAMESVDDLDTIWQQLSASYSRFVPFRDSTVDRWQRKTQLSSGATASKSKLRAFNQSISQQIEVHMRDFSRMLERMCLKRSSVEVIGMPAAQAQSLTAPNDLGTDLQDGSKDLNGDPELIDDTEFYQELLREFLESSDPSSLGTLYAVRKLRNKNRKVVDRRASKGRKIRYNVHDKIVNFMAPIPMNMPQMAEKLFSNGLFQGPTRPINL
eukprot:c25735_g1_i1 orf=320-1726(-)